MNIKLEPRDYIIIILICAFIYLKYENSCNKNSIEKMTEVKDIPTQITEEVNRIYMADIQAIRNLSDVSKKLQDKGLTIPGDLTVEGKFNYLPTGSIIAFNGITAPKGWVVCDGTQGTPDLRGRFIRMWNDVGFQQSSTEFGGSTKYTVKCKRSSDATKTLSAGKRTSSDAFIFKHSFGDIAGTDYTTLSTSEIPKHNHGEAGEHTHINNTWMENRKKGNASHKEDYMMYKKPDAESIETTRASGKHTHSDVGSGYSHGISNPYHVLTYIMKL